MDRTEPLTIVVNGSLDMQKEFHTRIRDNKTLVGAYGNNRIQDCMFRTNNEYGKEGDEPSDNIIIRNIDFLAKNVNNRILINIWSSRNIWVDHCTFVSELNRSKDEVGKFIWLNTPYESYMDAKDRLRSPDYITLSIIFSEIVIGRLPMEHRIRKQHAVAPLLCITGGISV